MANSSLCLTPACVQAAAHMTWQLAPHWKQLDPCTQFEEMVCHGFSEQHNPDSSTLGSMRRRNDRILKTILEGTYTTATRYKSPSLSVRDRDIVDENNFSKLQRDYLSCMNETAIEAVGARPLIDVVVRIDKIWPVTDADLKTTMTTADLTPFADAMLYLANMGVSTFQDISIGFHPLHPTNRTIDIAPPSLQLKQSSYADPKVIAEYKKTLAAIFQADVYPSQISDPLAVTIASGLVDFEVAIAKLFPAGASVQKRDVPSHLDKRAMGAPTPYNGVPLAEAVKLAPNLGLDRILTALAPKTFKITEVNLQNPQVTKGISNLITKTPKAIVQSWMVWRAIASLAEFVEDPALANIKPKTKPVERWQKCVSEVDRRSPIALSKFFVAAALPEKSRQLGDQMMTDIRMQFKKRIAQIPWMPEEVKKKAVAKVDDMKQFIGYPTTSPNLKDNKSIGDWYAGYNVTSSYFWNEVANRVWKTQKSASQLGTEVDESEFLSSPTGVNAYYVPSFNTITILSGIMQPSVFSPDLPSYAAYGGLGSVLGHELVHGFDDSGRLYDQTGAFQAWWDNKTVTEFEKRAQCFVGQYSNYTVMTEAGPMRVDGKLTLGENLADAGGLHTSYDAWKAKSGPADQKLPGLEQFTNDQLFFMFYANNWCSNPSIENAEAGLQDEHAPDEIRILGTLANSKGFREAWGCKAKEPTCELW